jgi:hypothetical protein
MHKRRVSILVTISALLAYSLIALAGSILLSVPTGAFALKYDATPAATYSPAAAVTPAPDLPSQGPCIIIGNPPPYCAPFVSKDKPPDDYLAQQGTLIRITGQNWTAHAAIGLYMLPVAQLSSESGNLALCPAQSFLIARNVARSAQVMSDAHGNFVAQLTIPATLKKGLYGMCLSLRGSGQMTSMLLFQINVKTDPQLQADPTGNAAPFSFNLSIIALMLALVALLLYIFSPRQPVAPHLTDRRKAS